MKQDGLEDTISDVLGKARVKERPRRSGYLAKSMIRILRVEMSLPDSWMAFHALRKGGQQGYGGTVRRCSPL